MPLVLIRGGGGAGQGTDIKTNAIAQNQLCKPQTYNNFYIWSISWE